MGRDPLLDSPEVHDGICSPAANEVCGEWVLGESLPPECLSKSDIFDDVRLLKSVARKLDALDGESGTSGGDVKSTRGELLLEQLLLLLLLLML
jgi:hypothetical protein